ncbi:MAG: ribonuclease HI [Gammaproteobacteria bacterium]|nr:MAG: ribonuclease HI [Gammaproteobacteria bacterium]
MIKNNDDEKVIIYTDGGCRGNPGPGGWGAVLEYQKTKKTIKGYMEMTTNNKMELTAAIEALKILKRPCKIDLWTDSTYVKDGITIWINNWIKKNWPKKIKNQELWKELHEQNGRHDIKWHWVKGHSLNPGNELADALANQAMDEAKNI